MYNAWGGLSRYSTIRICLFLIHCYIDNNPRVIVNNLICPTHDWCVINLFRSEAPAVKLHDVTSTWQHCQSCWISTYFSLNSPHWIKIIFIYILQMRCMYLASIVFRFIGQQGIISVRNLYLRGSWKPSLHSTLSTLNCAPGVQFSMSSVCLQASASKLHLSEFNRESCEFLNTVNVYDFKWTYLIIQTTTHTSPTNITADLTMHSTKSGILKIRI